MDDGPQKHPQTHTKTQTHLNAHLQFVRVMEAKKELSGEYHIALEATEAGNRKFYYAMVDVDSRLNHINLSWYQELTAMDQLARAYQTLAFRVCSKVSTVVWVQSWLNCINFMGWNHVSDGFLDPRSLSLAYANEPYRKPLTLDVTKPEIGIRIHDLALFAVMEHNERENAHLHLLRVVETPQEKIPSIPISVTLEEIDKSNAKENIELIRADTSSLDHITLEATDGDEQKIYRAVVRLSDPENWEELLELKPVVDDDY
ncbi:hypothetical protein F0562_031610 [Nyssa sinensis]|uniref:Cysteine proteinase inhibitor n=1 Tax=Nyssa sinensis TaxID=561372 RepID=A0A5J5AXK4_9ASTE|nr:hypothetical protein F0562_031610 [Nyssa sinensis]